MIEDNKLNNPVCFNAKIEIIQVMRAIAIICIMYYHTGYIYWDGANWGVSLFFIISGFMMMKSTEKEGAEYWRKRLIKILPLYYSMTFLTAIVHLIDPNVFRGSGNITLIRLVKSLLFIPYYSKGKAIVPVLSVGWTLYYEMFFYLVFWISMQLSWKYRGIICGSFLTILVIIGKCIEIDTAPLTIWTDTMLLEFVLGILSYYFIFILCTKTYTNKMTIIGMEGGGKGGCPNIFNINNYSNVVCQKRNKQ